MSDAEWVTPEGLAELARGLDSARLSEVADFIGYLKSRQYRELDHEVTLMEAMGAGEMAASLAEIEGGLPNEQVQDWLDELKAKAAPVHFNPEAGELEEGRP